MSSSERESHEFRGWNSRDAITSRHDFLTSLATWWNENVPRENLYLCRIFLNTYFYFTEVKLTFLWVNRVLRSVHWNNYLRSRKVNLCEIYFIFFEVKCWKNVLAKNFCGMCFRVGWHWKSCKVQSISDVFEGLQVDSISMPRRSFQRYFPRRKAFHTNSSSCRLLHLIQTSRCGRTSVSRVS